MVPLLAFLPLALAQTVEVEGAWVRAVPPSMAMTGFYGVLKNPGSEPIKLVGGETPLAEKVTVMETVMTPEGVMRMRHVDYLEIPAGGTLILKPMGDHVMIEGLKQPLVEGSELELTLIFDPQSQLTGKYPVRLEAPEQ